MSRDRNKGCLIIENAMRVLWRRFVAWADEGLNTEKLCFGGLAASSVAMWATEYQFPLTVAKLAVARDRELRQEDEQMVQDEWEILGGRHAIEVFPGVEKQHHAYASSVGSRVLVFPTRFTALAQQRGASALRRLGVTVDEAVEKNLWDKAVPLPLSAEEVRVLCKAELVSMRHDYGRFYYGLPLAVFGATSAAYLYIGRRSLFAVPLIAHLVTLRIAMHLIEKWIFEGLEPEERKTALALLEREQKHVGNNYTDLGGPWLSSKIRSLRGMH